VDDKFDRIEFEHLRNEDGPKGVVQDARSKIRVPGSKKLPGAIFNVRLLHGPAGVKYRDVFHIPASFPLITHSNFQLNSRLFYLRCWCG